MNQNTLIMENIKEEQKKKTWTVND